MRFGESSQNDERERKQAFWRSCDASNITKFNEKTPREGTKQRIFGSGDKEDKRELLGSHLRALAVWSYPPWVPSLLVRLGPLMVREKAKSPNKKLTNIHNQAASPPLLNPSKNKKNTRTPASCNEKQLGISVLPSLQNNPNRQLPSLQNNTNRQC